jgi:hypothetical protein
MTADLAWERKKRADDNDKLTPAELLRMAAEDLERGDYPHATRCIILIVEEPEDKNMRSPVHGYRCRMTRAEEIGYLEMWQHSTIERWQRS